MKNLIASIPGKTLAAKLRALMPEIDDRIKAGVQHQEIIDVLNEQGFNVNLNTFRSYLYRYRKTSRPLNQEPFLVNGNSQEVGHEETSSSESVPFDTFFDSRKRDKLSDKYMAQKKPIIKKKG